MRSIMAGVVVALLVAACGGAEASGPPEINYGRDLCIHCGMIISEAKFATAYRTDDGTEKKFDDVGGMVLHMRETSDEPSPESIWVHDFQTEAWVTASGAYFVPTSSETSPMGHSILAFSDESRATDFANDVDGDVITWATVFALPAMGGLLGDHHHSEGDMDHSDVEHGDE